MSWIKFNDSFNSLKGQITNFAANVLADDNTEADNVDPENIHDLQKLCSSQHQEISRLRELNEELSKSFAPSSLPQNNSQNDASWSWNEEEDSVPEAKNQIQSNDVVSDLKKNIEVLKKEKKELTVNLELLDSDFQQNTEKLVAMKDDLQTEYDKLENKYINLQDSHKALGVENEKLQKELKNKKSDVPMEELQRNSAKNVEKAQEKLTLSESENKILVAEMKKLSQSLMEFEETSRIDKENCEKLYLIVEGYEKDVGIVKKELEKAQESQKDDSMVQKKLEQVGKEKDDIHKKYINILTASMKKYIDNDESVKVESEQETDPNILEFSHQVENLMQIMRSLRSKCEQLETDLYNAKREKTDLLNEKNHEIEKLLHNSEILSQEVITKSQTIKDYENEYQELIKNNDMLINELNEYKNSSGLQTISESNEDNLLLLETQLENATKRIEELEAGPKQEKYKEENSDLKSTIQKLEGDNSFASEENQTLTSAIEQLRSDLENAEYQCAENNINIETLKEEIETQKKKTEQLLADNLALEKSNCEYEKNAENTRGELNILREKLIFEEDNRRQSENQIRIFSEKLQNAKMSETGLKLQYDTLNKEIIASNEIRNNLEATLKDLKGNLTENEENLQTLREENDSLKKMLEELLTGKENNDNVVEVENINEEKVKFQEEIETLKKQIEEVNASKNELTNVLITKHQENITYHNEIQRLSQLLTAEMAKSSSSEQHNEELDKVKDQNEFLRQKCEVLAENLLQEQSNLQQVLAERSSEKEAMAKKLERLQSHLIEMEDHYTQELLSAEERNAILQGKVNEIELREKNSSTIFTSVSIRANQQVETLQHQLQLITSQRDELRKKLSDAEDNACKQATSLITLQSVLEQFQREKDNDVLKETERLRRQIANEKRLQDELKIEISNLTLQLDESKQGLQAASRLSDQLESSKQLITSLKTEVSQLKEQLCKNEEQMSNLSGQTDGKVDKSLIKNLIIGLVTTNNNLNKDQLQILKIIATVLDFNQQDHEKVNLSKPQQGWLGSLLSPHSTQGMSQESLSQAFVKFLENESKPRLVPSLLSDQPTEDPKSRKTSVVRQSPSVLSDVVLPTFADFAQNRNSSSILKDILKDNS